MTEATQLTSAAKIATPATQSCGGENGSVWHKFGASREGGTTATVSHTQSLPYSEPPITNECHTASNAPDFF